MRGGGGWECGEGNECLEVPGVVGVLSLSNFASVGSLSIYSAAEKVAENTEKKFKVLNQENQRLRTTLQSVRLGAQNEVKRFEKEKDKLLERLSKIADSRPTAQFACSNLNVSTTEGKFEKGFLDIALEDAENARVNLAEENDILKKLVVDCANGAQGLMHRIKYRGDERHMVDEVRCAFFSILEAIPDIVISLLL